MGSYYWYRYTQVYSQVYGCGHRWGNTRKPAVIELGLTFAKRMLLVARAIP